MAEAVGSWDKAYQNKTKAWVKGRGAIRCWTLLLFALMDYFFDILGMHCNEVM